MRVLSVAINSTQLNFIITYLQPGSWTAKYTEQLIKKYNEKYEVHNKQLRTSMQEKEKMAAVCVW